MAAEEIIPSTYEKWRECIEVRCKIRLTPEFIAKRLAELGDQKNSQTRRFEELYGKAHLERTVDWFRRAADEPSA